MFAPRQACYVKQMHAKQQGAVLLILLTIIVLGGAYLLITRLNSASGQLLQNQHTVDALSQARDALIGYALTYAEKFPGQPQGYLPCPDITGDGSANTPCGIAGQSVVGRLPWVQLGLPALKDGAGECLWYVVSGGYKNNPKASLTSDTDGQLIIKSAAGNTVTGATPTTQAIALIIGAGSIVNAQDRRFTSSTRTECGSATLTDPVNQVVNYLDALGNINNVFGTDANAGSGMPGSLAMPVASPNQTLASVFVNAAQVNDANGNVIFNDVIMAISPADFSNVYVRMDQWAGKRVVSCLEDYQAVSSGKFPWVSDFNAGAPPDYTGDSSAQYGRIPDAGGFSLDGDPQMNNVWTIDSATSIFVTCFDESNKAQDGYWWWWDAWKEMVFLGVDVNFAPNGTTNPATALSLDGVAQAAVVLVSGRRLAGKFRDSNAQKADISNYLEAANNNTGDGAFISGPATDVFNDVVLPVTSVMGP